VSRLWLYYKAPFAAYRMFQAGDYRASLPVMPFSTAWGLVLNLAGIEIRGNLNQAVTPILAKAPPLRLALGILQEPEANVLYQQLHRYPIAENKEMADLTHGAKYWISPVRREVLAGVEGVIGLETADPALSGAIAAGLRGEYSHERYGLPFAGDNNLLFDRLELIQDVPAARWLVRHPAPLAGQPAHRLTVAINREDSSQTVSALFTLEDEWRTQPPTEAWCWTPRAPQEEACLN